MLSEQAINFLTSIGATEETASAAQLSDANAYSTCYDWYITAQKVLPENAALASKVWVQKYALHNADNICCESTPEDMWDRIAITLAQTEMETNPDNDKDFVWWKNYFRSGLQDYAYSPQGSGLYSLGNPYVKASSSNCFVLPPPEDSLDGIFETAKNTAKIYASRGGVGFSLSKLRPRKAKTANAAKTSTGAVSFMDFYSYVTGMIGQEGRRGAEMLSLEVSHPDIFHFIREKRDENKQEFFSSLDAVGIDINDYRWSAIADRLKSTSHANVSVMINDHFMDCVKNDLTYELKFDFEGDLYPAITRTVKATDIWNELMKSAWESAEPGILNWDHIVRECPADQYGEEKEYSWFDPIDKIMKLTRYSFRTVGVNPCAEETLSAYDSCNLGIFNLPLFIKNAFTKAASFDWEKYEAAIILGIRAQDNIKEWDIPRLPLELNRMAGILGRRISVGNTGLADCLAALGLRYDSDEGIEMAEKIYEFLANVAYTASAFLAKTKGAFPAFDLKKALACPFIQRLKPETIAYIKQYGLRNIGLLTQAPAGSMSILFRNCASGIEPVYMLEYARNVKKHGSKDFEQHIIRHQAVEDCILAGGDPSVFVPAAAINWSKRIMMQSRIQKHIDHSISSTINLPNTVTVEEVSKIYMEAYDAGLKGITVYRDGCRTGVLVSNEKKVAAYRQGQVIERPKTTEVDIHKTKYKEKNYMILVGKVENGHPIEIFGGLEDGLSLPTTYKSATLTKKSRGHYSLTIQLSEDEEDIMKVNNVGNRFPAQDIMTLTRMISLSLRNGISVSDIVEQLNKATTALYDAPAVFARVLKQYISDEDAINKEKAKGKVCPECGAALEYKRESGCVTELCSSCTYSNSKCG